MIDEADNDAKLSKPLRAHTKGVMRFYRLHTRDMNQKAIRLFSRYPSLVKFFMTTLKFFKIRWQRWSNNHPIASLLIVACLFSAIFQPIVRLVNSYLPFRRGGWYEFIAVFGFGALYGAINVAWIYLNPFLPPKHTAAETRAARYVAIVALMLGLSLVWMSYRL